MRFMPVVNDGTRKADLAALKREAETLEGFIAKQASAWSAKTKNAEARLATVQRDIKRLEQELAEGEADEGEGAENQGQNPQATATQQRLRVREWRGADGLLRRVPVKDTRPAANADPDEPAFLPPVPYYK